MNPTQLIPGDRNLPVPAGDTAPEAYQRAPTLMAGDGSHGEVRVWSPDMAVIRRRVWGGGAGCAGMFAVTVLIPILFHGAAGTFTWPLVMAGMVFFYGIAALRRPCYLTTDESGMGVTTSKASRALLWGEIQSVQVGDTFGNPLWVLTLGSKESLTLNLVGYSPDARNSLLELLREKVGLEQHSKEKMLYERPPLTLPPGERTN